MACSLNSRELGAFLVGKLVNSALIRAGAVPRAIDIAEEEIEARTAIGDFDVHSPDALTNAELAGLILDALIVGRVLPSSALDESLSVIVEQLDLRRVIGG